MATTLPSMKYQNNHRTVTGTITVKDNDVVLNCDTSVGAVTINLLQIPDNYWNTQYRIYIVDSGNNAATNNITINAGTNQTIDNFSSKVISTSGDRVVISVSSNNSYITIDAVTATALTKLQVNNTVFVMKNGSDSTGLVERMDKPFLTITAARTAALSYFSSRTQNNRVKIVVESGYYQEPIYLDDFIDYDLGNSVIESTTASVATIQVNGGNYTSTTNGVPNVIIYGNAIIKCSVNNTATIHFLSARYIKVLINCNIIHSNSFFAILMRTGKLTVYGNVISNSNSSTPDRQVIAFATSNVYPEAPQLEVHNCKIFSNQNTSGASTIQFYNGVAGVISTEYSKLILVNCQVGNWASARAAIETTVDDGTTAKGYGEVYLYNSVIFSNAAYVATTSTVVGTGCINDYYGYTAHGGSGDAGAIKVYSYGAYSNRNYFLGNPVSSMNVGNILVDPIIPFNNGVTI